MLKGEKMNPIPKEERATLWCKECKQDLPRLSFRTEGYTTAGRQKYCSRCKPCWKKYIETKDYGLREKRARIQLVMEHKIQCVNCGYDKYHGALEFHHVDDSTKKFSISDATRIRYEQYTNEEVINEIKKCVVLCSNCHREVHGKVLTLNEFFKENEHNLCRSD